MQTGWTLVDGKWNYFANSGAMQTGWVKDKDIWFYLDKDGNMLTGNQEINGSRYYFKASGAMKLVGNGRTRVGSIILALVP